MSDDWNVYRTRFLVRAKQLSEFVEFTDPLGRHHSGKPGDYLVQSSEGLLRIAPRAAQLINYLFQWIRACRGDELLRRRPRL